METGSRRGDVKAAMTFIQGGRADHGRPSLEFVANDPASVASLALKDNLPPRKLRGTWSSAEGLMSGAASPGRCWPRAAPIACLRLRQRRKEFGDGRMRLRLASVRSRTAGVMTALMRNGRDRRLGEPVMGHAILERVLLFGTRSADYIRASGHNDCIATEVILQATTEAEYMTAPERFADSQIPLAPRAPSIHDPQWNWSVHRSSPGLLRDHLFHRLVGACEHGRRKGEARD